MASSRSTSSSRPARRAGCEGGSRLSRSESLLDDWAALLERRSGFRATLAPYGRVLDAWARTPEAAAGRLEWGADECRDRWRRGVPLLAEAPPAISPGLLEDQVGAALEFLAVAGVDDEALRRAAVAWDEGSLRPEDLLPRPGRLAAPRLTAETGLSGEALDFVACVALRPVLSLYFAPCREHLPGDAWDAGVCPFCGAPPGFGELGDDGKLRLACHVCSGSWAFGRLRCPFCGSGSPDDLLHFQGEDSEEGYAIRACGRCRGYLKVLDRRARWNAGTALAEDWGSPHLDLVAVRRGYWRAIPTLIQLRRPTEE